MASKVTFPFQAHPVENPNGSTLALNPATDVSPDDKTKKAKAKTTTTTIWSTPDSLR